MPTTPYRGYELYSDTASPDLSASGEYNKAINAIDADMHEEIETRVAKDTKLGGRIDAEASERKAADSALDAKIAKEVADRGNADTALSGRIDNAEAEISANSADLTGIKGLTYGPGQQVFLETDNGSYSSPALVEIRHEIEQASSSKENALVVTADDPTGANASATYAEIATAFAANKPVTLIIRGLFAMPLTIADEGKLSFTATILTPDAVQAMTIDVSKNNLWTINTQYIAKGLTRTDVIEIIANATLGEVESAMIAPV